jgi:hypothetical protein
MEVGTLLLLYYISLFISAVYMIGLIPAYFISKLYIKKLKSNRNIIIAILLSWITVGVTLIIWIIQIFIGLFLWKKDVKK